MAVIALVHGSIGSCSGIQLHLGGLPSGVDIDAHLGNAAEITDRNLCSDVSSCHAAEHSYMAIPTGKTLNQHQAGTVQPLPHTALVGQGLCTSLAREHQTPGSVLSPPLAPHHHLRSAGADHLSISGKSRLPEQLRN